MNICVVGLGYVGLPLASVASKVHAVTGIDIDADKVTKINQKICPLQEPYTQSVFAESNFSATTSFDSISTADIILVCVPTPVTEEKTPDLTPLKGAVESIAPYLKSGQLIIIESTVYPGTTEEVIIPLLEEKSGLRACKDIGIAYCPERIDPGNTKWNVQNIPRVVGVKRGQDGTTAKTFYQSIVNAEITVLNSIKAAEATKILENSFRDVNIAFINEIAMSFDKFGIDTLEVIKGAATKPFGYMPFYPGPGVGGHCISVDPYYLIERSKKNEFDHRFLELARKINDGMPSYVVDVVQQELNKLGSSVKGAKIGVYGLAYKKDVEDTRNSPAAAIIKKLKELEAELVCYDPYVESDCHNVQEFFSKIEYLIICTDHSEIKQVRQEMFNDLKAVTDTRNCLSEEVRNSVNYRGVGRATRKDIKPVKREKDNVIKLILTRHGKTIENGQGILQGQLPGTLSDKGRMQAVALADALQGIKIDKIFCSDLQRCVDTIAPFLQNNPHIPIIYTHETREMSFGSLEGMPYLGWEKIKNEGKQRAGESFEELLQRAQHFLERLRMHNNKTILIVSHGAFLKALKCALTDGNINHDLIQQHVFPQGSLSEIELHADGSHTINYIGKEDHLNESTKTTSWNELTQKTFIIAEIGKNFIQTEEEKPVAEYLANAKELVREAKNAGANAVKFQTHNVEDEQLNIDVISPHFKGSDRYSWVRRNTRSTPIDEFWKPLKAYCDELGIMFFATPMSRGAAHILNEVDVPIWKVGSGDILDFITLNYIASTGKPVCFSTGMSTLEESEKAINYLKSKGADVLVFHCISKYPCPPEDLQLSTIEFYNERWDLPIGFSDHSIGYDSAIAAVALGAKAVEKHFSLSRDLWGSDHKVSMTPAEFRVMVDGIREIEADPSKRAAYLEKDIVKRGMGVKGKTLQEGEAVFRDYFRKSLMAGADIPAGTVITKEMVYAMRPQKFAGGLPSEKYEDVVGKVAKMRLKKFDPITSEVVE